MPNRTLVFTATFIEVKMLADEFHKGVVLGRSRCQLHPPDEKPVGISQTGEPCRCAARDGQLQVVQETHNSLGGSRLETLST